MQGHCTTVGRILCLQKELRRSVPAIKGYRTDFHHVFALAGTDLTDKSSAECSTALRRFV